MQIQYGLVDVDTTIIILNTYNFQFVQKLFIKITMDAMIQRDAMVFRQTVKKEEAVKSYFLTRNQKMDCLTSLFMENLFLLLIIWPWAFQETTKWAPI